MIIFIVNFHITFLSFFILACKAYYCVIIIISAFVLFQFDYA